MDVGSFVEIGADGDTPALVAEILRVDTVAGRPLVTARVKDLNSNKEPVFTHEGTIRRKGPDARGIYHWVIYHPGAKLLLGIRDAMVQRQGLRWAGRCEAGGITDFGFMETVLSLRAGQPNRAPTLLMPWA